ncbi:hypothetical protein SAMN05216412_101545 [Nitrosospira multiformis]|uniref:Uncharacterized protein n=1 Tax=Nitrosospira multiformis TaxID=1231 RepID=A0A1H9Z8K2_9PROT|nr:hypothetical protein SAMN05216412_101545 [Nitrosospira multiformis]
MLSFYRFTLRKTRSKPVGGYILSLFDLRQAQGEREDVGLVRAGDEGLSTNSVSFSHPIRALASMGNWRLAEGLKLELR